MKRNIGNKAAPFYKSNLIDSMGRVQNARFQHIEYLIARGVVHLQRPYAIYALY